MAFDSSTQDRLIGAARWIRDEMPYIIDDLKKNDPNRAEKEFTRRMQAVLERIRTLESKM